MAARLDRPHASIHEQNPSNPLIDKPFTLWAYYLLNSLNRQYLQGLLIMLVSEKLTLFTPLSKRLGEDPTAQAAAGLQGAMMQALQNNVQTQTAQASEQVQASATQIATQQVNQASKTSDNLNEAFAKTRVNLQASTASTPASTQDTVGSGSATDEFKDYMSKTPEQRLRDSILKEMGLTEDQVKAMPPEQQLAIGKEIAERMQDKVKLAQAEKDNGSSDKGSSQVVDKFLASL
jgi:uncharacterized membrane protein